MDKYTSTRATVADSGMSDQGEIVWNLNNCGGASARLKFCLCDTTVLPFLLWFWFLHDSMTHDGLFSAVFSLFTWALLLVNL